MHRHLLKFCIFAGIVFSTNIIYASKLDYIIPNRSPTYSNYGGVGLMMIPSAQFSEAGTLAFTFSDSNLFRFGTIVTNPFNWFEASYFYVSDRKSVV